MGCYYTYAFVDVIPDDVRTCVISPVRLSAVSGFHRRIHNVQLQREGTGEDSDQHCGVPLEQGTTIILAGYSESGEQTCL